MAMSCLAMFHGVALAILAAAAPTTTPAAVPVAAPDEIELAVRARLDAPLLFVKRHSYTGIHIYDTYYKWPPGGGGIYVLENPSAPRAQWKIRPVIDETTPGTLGHGVYTHPELSWDAKNLLFCFKGQPDGSTSIYEIGIDGRGLRRLSDPACACECYKGSRSGQHDIAPAYLPDGRIVCLSTRPSGLVPCANSGVSILHVMNADGSDLHSISVNNVNEFDPAVLPDGRILFGRWEYVDKNALTIQSLWTVNPDGTQETAFFANNMVFPESILDARPVAGTHLVVGTFAKHNSTPRGSIGLVDPRLGKNSPAALVNLEHPEDPTYDRGDSCEPWPVTPELFLYSGRPKGTGRNVLQLIDRSGKTWVLMSDPAICLHAPMLVKPRPTPKVIPDQVDRKAIAGRFFLQDIYQGLDGVQRGTVKWLRVIEETSRVSPTTMGGSPYNQTFLVSAALAFSVKNYLGVVPVDPNGSAYFEAPAGRAIYFQALDGDGRLVQSMRTFVQAAPGTVRSCVGCHEYKYAATGNRGLPSLLTRAPDRPRPESWGSGYIDYPSMIQPVLDRNCVSCHGGAKDIAAGLDLSGGWTQHFNISYENLVSRRETQLVAYWISGIDCMNGTALWSSQLFPPRSHGSGAAPLAKLLVEGHPRCGAKLPRQDRDLLLAWIDSNGLYHGTWDYNANGCAIKNWDVTKEALVAQMKDAGCLECHGGNTPATRPGAKPLPVAYFESDWINLQRPELSRLLRAPLAKGTEGAGLALCRDRKVDPQRQRLHLLRKGYAHAVQPPEMFPKHPIVPYDASGTPKISFASAADKHYQAMLTTIRAARAKALENSRVDMPGAEVIAGKPRIFLPPPLAPAAPPLKAELGADGVVELAWERSARTIGQESELHAATVADFAPSEETLLTRTELGRHSDRVDQAGPRHYALVMVTGKHRSRPSYASVRVPPPQPPAAPTGLAATPGSLTIRLAWQSADNAVAYHVYRLDAGGAPQRLTAEPIQAVEYYDTGLSPEVPQRYHVRGISRRGAEGTASATVSAAATLIRPAVFAAPLDRDLKATLLDGSVLEGMHSGPARCSAGCLDLTRGGHVGFAHRAEFDLRQPLAIEFWVKFTEPGKMPVVLSCGRWRDSGWFLQRIGGGWRWHVGGVDCDGGRAAHNRWVHMAADYDGRQLRLFQDGVEVAHKEAAVKKDLWSGELCIGQYSEMHQPDFQVTGQMADVKIYHRPLQAAEVAATAAKGR